MSFFIAQVNVIQMISKSGISTVQAKCVQNQTDISSSIHVHTNVSVDMNKCISRHGQMYQWTWTNVSVDMDKCISGHGQMYQWTWTNVSVDMDKCISGHGQMY
jgi:predicted RNA-binding protein YlqC (UPF0109 family)